jgi:putative SOS response-associated peptidase YedK
MCSHFEAPNADRLRKAFGRVPTQQYQLDVWPTYSSAFVTPGAAGEQPQIRVGMFGLLPHWAADKKLARRTYNARSETVASKPSFRSAWSRGQRCIIPATAIYEPDWNSGKAIPARISRSDGGLLLIAGLWEQWKGEGEDVVESFTMLTVNADDHPLMKRFHRPEDEKRMVVMLPSSKISLWLGGSTADAQKLLTQYPAEKLTSSCEPDGA